MFQLLDDFVLRLRPWSPLGDFCPQDPLLLPLPTNVYQIYDSKSLRTRRFPANYTATTYNVLQKSIMST